ncbi:MAG TPA: thioredoxin family protein [Bacteroidales bacterium]|nr:thioredoxin family protein [Bacteroidales bacterium]HRZ76342.1 thioredoxin family protein [Bacteroidales bacterium]
MNDTTYQGEAVRDILQQEPAVMLYFYNDHCAPCISLRPKVEYLIEQEFPRMKLVMVNGESEALTAASFGVFSHPTLILFFEGKEYIRESKYVSIGQLDRAIRRPYDLLFQDQSL